MRTLLGVGKTVRDVGRFFGRLLRSSLFRTGLPAGVATYIGGPAGASVGGGLGAILNGNSIKSIFTKGY